MRYNPHLPRHDEDGVNESGSMPGPSRAVAGSTSATPRPNTWKAIIDSLPRVVLLESLKFLHYSDLYSTERGLSLVSRQMDNFVSVHEARLPAITLKSLTFCSLDACRNASYERKNRLGPKCSIEAIKWTRFKTLMLDNVLPPDVIAKLDSLSPHAHGMPIHIFGPNHNNLFAIIQVRDEGNVRAVDQIPSSQLRDNTFCVELPTHASRQSLPSLLNFFYQLSRPRFDTIHVGSYYHWNRKFIELLYSLGVEWCLQLVCKDYEEGAVCGGRWGGADATDEAGSSKQESVLEFMRKNGHLVEVEE